MDLKELQSTHEYYDVFLEEWTFTQAAYDGTRALIRINAIKRHERESYNNYQKRLEQAFGFAYSKSIVDLLNHYLFRKAPKITMPEVLTKNKQWQEFVKDCNLMEDNLNDFMLEQSRFASIQGHVGILIDKASTKTQTVADELKAGIYPYLSAYRPTSILDWEMERDESNRPYLSYLKLKDDDGQYRIWTREAWEIWREPEKTMTVGTVSKTASGGTAIGTRSIAMSGEEIELVAQGDNRLGEIPFVWLFNMKGSYQGIGVSDIGDIAYIDVSIIRNLSQGEEVVDYAAFPMMRKPMQEAGSGVEPQDDTGPAVILEFDPEHPESKPDWLDSAVQEPITAIVTWIAQKISEIYRSANIGGLQATETSAEAKSGIALRTEFQMLNARLAAKARNLQKAHRRILYYWLRWQSLDSVYSDIELEYPQDFDIENLAEDLANILTSKSIVVSELFRRYLQKMVARRMLPTLSEKEMAEIDKDIDSAPSEEELYRQELELAAAQLNDPAVEGDPSQDLNPDEPDEEVPPNKLKQRAGAGK